MRWQWHQLYHMQIIFCTSLQTDNHARTLSLNFYRPDALPDAQPTVSNCRRKMNLSVNRFYSVSTKNGPKYNGAVFEILGKHH